MKKKLGLACLGLLALLILAMAIAPERPKPSATLERPMASRQDIPPPKPTGVTQAAYIQIQPGMTYTQVRMIIGSAGEEISRSDIAGYTTIMYVWKNWNGSNMNAMFQNERLVNKAQFGLR